MKKVFCFLLTIVFFLSAKIVFADPTDTGQIVVNATIPPVSSYFTSTVTADKTGTQKQGTEITYTITYNSTYVSSSDIVLQADWTQGTISGASLPTVDVAEYVVGSASTAYNGATPIIDSLNRTITWNISAFPPSTQGSASFTLITTSNYTGDNAVSFDINTHISDPVITPIVSVTSSYTHEKSATTTSQTTSTPTPTTTPFLESTEIITTETAYAKNIAMKEIGATSASIIVETTIPSSLRIKYGVSQDQLSKTLVILEKNIVQNFVLTDLNPATKYYFQVERDDGSLLVNDIFLFTTGQGKSGIPEIKPQSLVVTQKGSILYNGGVIPETGIAPPLTAISNSVVEMYLTVLKDESLSSVELFIRQWKILGVQNDVNEQFQSSNALLTEVAPQTYAGKLKVPEAIGQYQIVTRIKDVYGNFKEFTLVKLNVISNLTITDANSGQPINNAKITVYLFNSEKRLFEYISPAATSIKNPTYSDQNGVVFLNLAPGVYKIIVESFGYKTVDFQFGIGTNESFSLPQIALHSISDVIIIQKMLHWISSLLNLLFLFGQHMLPIAQSLSFYNFMLITSCILCLCSGLFGYYLKKHPHVNVDELLIYHRKFMTQQIISFILYVGLEFVVFMSEFFILFALIYIYFFTTIYGFWETLPFIIFVLMALLLMLFDSFIYIKRKV